MVFLVLKASCVLMLSVEVLSAVLQSWVVYMQGPVLPQACRKTAPWDSGPTLLCGCVEMWSMPTYLVILDVNCQLLGKIRVVRLHINPPCVSYRGAVVKR